MAGEREQVQLAGERSFFSVEDRGGVKWLHYHGYTYLGKDGSWRCVDLTLCEAPLSVALAYGQGAVGWMRDAAERAGQHEEAMDEEGMRALIDGYYVGAGAGSLLDPSLLADATPCGSYCHVDAGSARCLGLSADGRAAGGYCSVGDGCVMRDGDSLERVYAKYLETEGFRWYVDPDESDENGKVAMFRIESSGLLALASDNVFAANALVEAMESVHARAERALFMSDDARRDMLAIGYGRDEPGGKLVADLAESRAAARDVRGEVERDRCRGPRGL